MKARGKCFLSESHVEGGSISWSVTTKSVSLYEPMVEASLSLRDCYKQIDIDFNCNEYKHLEKRLAKLDTLMIELTKMREALVIAGKELKPKRFYY